MPKFTLKDFRQEMGAKWKLVPHLERCIQEFDEEWTFTYQPKEHDLYWHPSSDCVPTASELYDSAQHRLNSEHDETFARKMRKYGMIGHFWHQYLQHLLVRYDMCGQTDIERRGTKFWGKNGDAIYNIGESTLDARPFHACTGAADVAPINIPRYGEYLVDFKTMASAHYKAVTLPPFFAEKYECQINIYLDFFDLDKALVVGINKDTPHDMKEFEYRRNDELVAAIYDKWKFVADCLEHGDRPSDIDDANFPLPLEQL